MALISPPPEMLDGNGAIVFCWLVDSFGGASLGALASLFFAELCFFVFTAFGFFLVEGAIFFLVVVFLAGLFLLAVFFEATFFFVVAAGFLLGDEVFFRFAGVFAIGVPSLLNEVLWQFC